MMRGKKELVFHVFSLYLFIIFRFAFFNKSAMGFLVIVMLHTDRLGLSFCFQRGGKVYLISSMMTGYFPNPSRAAVADGPNGPFTGLGDLHPADKSRSSFNSQISYIFKHPRKKDLYIALADRWLPELSGRPDFESGELSETVRSAIRKAT